MGRVPRMNHKVKEGLSRSRHLIQESTSGNAIKVFRVSVSLKVICRFRCFLQATHSRPPPPVVSPPALYKMAPRSGPPSGQVFPISLIGEREVMLSIAG